MYACNKLFHWCFIRQRNAKARPKQLVNSEKIVKGSRLDKQHYCENIYNRLFNLVFQYPNYCALFIPERESEISAKSREAKS